MPIPNHRWVAREARWIIKDDKQCWMTGLVRTRGGDLLMSAYRGGMDQMNGGEVLYRSRDHGVTWCEETVLSRWVGVEAGAQGWQTLRSGRILAVQSDVGTGQFRETGGSYTGGPAGCKPMPRTAYWCDSSQPMVRTLYSDDDGHTWETTDPSPLPVSLECQCECRLGCGPIVEMPDGTLILPGHAFLNEEDEKAFIFSPCIFRSSDQGMTWGDCSIVARGEADIGNCYNETGVLPLADGQLMAFFRMNPTHYGRALYGYRCFSADQGRIWSIPEQCLQAPGEMDMLHLPDGGLMVTGKGLSSTRFNVSYDSGRSWAYQGNIYEVPHGAGWDGEGWKGNTWAARAVVLDEETVLVIHSPWHQRHLPGARARWIRKVQIPAIREFRSVFTADEPPRDRWVVREARPVYRGELVPPCKHDNRSVHPNFRKEALAARNPQISRTANGDLLVSVQVGTPLSRTIVLRSIDGGVAWSESLLVHEAASVAEGGGLTLLQSGRLVMACGEQETTSGTLEPTGEVMPGVPRFRLTGVARKSVMRTAVSDDNGHSWRISDPLDTAPFVGATAAGRLIELPGGALAIPITGALSEADMDGALNSCGLLRSRDGGESWSPATIVAGADAADGRSFEKLSLLPLADHSVVAAIETVSPQRGPHWERMVSFSYSGDGGDT